MDISDNGQQLAGIVKEYSELGLPFPPLPRELAAQLRKVGRHCYSTVSDPEPLFNTADFIQQLSSMTQPLLFFGLGGHGINSQSFHYTLACNEIILILVQPLSQLGDASQTDRQGLEKCLNEFEQLFLGSVALHGQQLLNQERLVVLENGAGLSRLAVIDSQGSFDLLSEDRSTVTQAAAQWLEDRLQSA